MRRLCAAMATVAVVTAGCTFSDDRSDDGYERLGATDGFVVLARLPESNHGERRIDIRMRGEQGLLCNASGPVTLKVMVCDTSVGDQRALALAVPSGAASVVAELPSGGLPLTVLPSPEGWPVTVAAAIIEGGEFETVLKVVARDAAGEVLDEG